MGKIIDMATRGEIVAFLPTKKLPVTAKRVVDKENVLKELTQSMERAEQLLRLLELAPSKDRQAFQAFMQRLGPTLSELSDKIQIVDNVSWIKIEGLATQHRVYISKGKFAVNRVDCTLPVGVVPGSVQPTNHNGNIASWIPADVESVAFAVRLLVSEETAPLHKQRR